VKVVTSFRLWLVVLVVVAVAAVVTNPAGHGPADRVAHLEELVKCPSCENLSVAQSNSTSALAVRHEIATMVKAGNTDAQILTTIEAAYGPSVLLSPRTSGLGVLLWLSPTLVVLLFFVIGWRLRRRR
jgi:cytochrome c-type biogenesis protein CcmH